MIKKICLLLPLFLLSQLSAHDYHNLVSNTMLKTSIGYSEFTDSKQKTDARVYTLSVHSKIDKHKIELYQLYSKAHTIQPPISEDLEVSKTFARYSYDFSKQHNINVSFMDITDNLVPTDGGKIYGLGYIYKQPQYFRVLLNQYHSDYKDFSVNQSDVNIQFHKELDAWEFDVNVMLKSISLNNYSNSIFNPKFKGSEPDDNYLTTGIKLHTAYQSYHAGVGAWFGDRIFAVMNNGFATQHHAMRFTEGYFVTVGKKFKGINVIAKYTYQKADELPSNTFDVGVESFSLQVAYKF